MVAKSVYVLEVEGEFDYVGAPQVRQELDAARGAGATAVVFDMRRVTFMDSAGLRVVVDAIRGLGSQCVALAGTPDPVLRLLATTGLDQRLRLFSTVEDAVIALVPRH